jgi:HK97 family phage major capsid protein
MRELQAQIQQKHQEAQGYMAEGENKDLTKAEALLNEADELQKEFDLAARMAKADKALVPDDAKGQEGGTPDEPEKPEKVDAVKSFADAARSRFKANMNETTGAEGGYTVPEDISTKINEYREERFSLATLIDYEAVNTLAGKRTYKTRSQHKGFTVVGEGGKITQSSAPAFERISYSIKKYGGYIPVTNELLEDSDAAIASMLISWLGEEAIATDNAQILEKVNAKESTAITGIKDIKKAINVTLAAFAGTVRIVTNSDGLQYLDTLEDSNKRPLLSPDPVKPMEAYLSVGVRRIPVVVVPNEVLATADGKIPFIMGDLKEYVKKFDRKQITIKTSDSAAVEGFNAFEEDMTLFRALMRADYVVKDSAAIVRGELTVTA